VLLQLALVQVLQLERSPPALVALVRPELLLAIALVEPELLALRAQLDPIYQQLPAQRVRAQPWHQRRQRRAPQL